MLLGAGLWSCGKDDDNNNEGTGNTYVDPNPQNPGDDPQPQPQPQPVGDWVDLGLPSGLLWATRNVGATSPEDYGNYYAWGETEPKSFYSWSTYAYGNAYNQLTRYCTQSAYGDESYTDDCTILLPGDDAAAANVGNGARTPTKDEWQELIDNTTFTWTSMNGVHGGQFTASNGNSLFLPATGNFWDDEVHYAGDYGNYWSSSLYINNPGDAWSFGISGALQDVDRDSRYVGHSVRAVRQGN